MSALSEPEKSGDFIGNSVIISGPLMALSGTLLYIRLIDITIFVLFMIASGFIPLPAFFYAKSKFSKKGEHRHHDKQKNVVK